MRGLCGWMSLVLAGVVLAPLAVRAADCPVQPQTAYERVYCQVVEKGGGRRLPSFDDFRRNSPQVQALLLKRQAARLGIELPDAMPEPSSGSRQEVPAAAPAPIHSLPAPEPEQAPAPGSAVAFRECRLAGETIECPRRQYHLATNLPNRALAEGVLDDDNRLGLQSYQGDPNNETELRRYLARAYDRYIRKMLEIGLGGATMSFTRFYHGFQRHEASGVDYAQRLEATFHLLKQDKKTRPVPSRLTGHLPRNLQHCEGVGQNVIVCDNVASNWVFVGE
ncbi:MAG: hypothetical protein R3175_04180 [Marinobacter sp.]|uniref:hypothetical protein n=1 Tax=Marinobacter sp. TaxID=50741 RepID=UPI00299CDA6C|nr:hypothetical protein [Marinobacter sp.]MDX1755238.1 hypothetical protein [Marinobacter sp.]